VDVETIDFSEREAMINYLAEPEMMISKVGLEQITLIVAKESMIFWT
jgi:hypothetical protein